MTQSRIVFFRQACLAVLGCLVLRLGYLQLLHGSSYRRLAEQNRLRVVPQPAPRGVILDRMGRRIAANRMIFRLAALPQDVGDGQALFERLGRIAGLPGAQLQRRYAKQRSLPFVPVALTQEIPKPIALRVEEERLHLPGVLVESVAMRHYPLGPLAAHLIGYLSQPSQEEFPALKHYGVRSQDFVGRAGLERELDAYLRGRSGGSLIEVDHLGRQVGVLGYRQPVPGEQVVLSIDAELSALIAQQFGRQPGSCVVLQPHTGEVLAMVSVPGFEPSLFARQDADAISRLLADQQAALFDRAAQGLYQPGSIVKLVTAITALEHRLITPKSLIECRGYITIGDRRFHCWNRDGHGSVDLLRALTVSCNVYFMQLGRRVGLERLRANLAAVGFGRPVGWALESRRGQLPYGRWFSEGEVALLAMGQGEIAASPLQAAIMASAFANQGMVVEPWVVGSIGGHRVARAHVAALGWSKESLSVVRDGMLAVVNDPQGTGVGASSAQVRIAGKTGTAQTHMPGRPHGWFVGFCPAQNPVAAMAIIAEHGGSGGELPSAIARTICEYLIAHPTAYAAMEHSYQNPLRTQRTADTN